jgi:Insertion element 4 transposase N-terminal/Transposase DDE domain
MARTKAVLGVGARLTDFLSTSLLASVYPPQLVEAILDEHGVNSQRVRSIPALVSTYYCMALSLYPDAAYEEVFSAVAQGLAWTRGAKAAVATPTIAKSSISAARTKLGYAPLQALHQRACKPLANIKAHPKAFYAGLRVVAIDGSNIEIPDEAANEKVFGRPGSRTGRAAYPQAQSAILVECATHAVLAGNIGPYAQYEWDICKPLIATLDATMLCLADRGFDGYAHWNTARANGAQLLWRVKNNRELPVVKMLKDGSYLSAIYPDVKSRKGRAGEVTVRVIEYAMPGQSAANAADDGTAQYRLMTTLLDPEVAPALELAALYHERWEVELVFDELKVHLKNNRRTFRSKTPDGVIQEFYGWLLAHYAVCWLKHQAATAHGLEDRSLSFVGNTNLLRRAQTQIGAFPPRKNAV